MNPNEFSLQGRKIGQLFQKSRNLEMFNIWIRAIFATEYFVMVFVSFYLLKVVMFFKKLFVAEE